MKKRIFTILCGALFLSAGLFAQDTILYYGWEDGTSPEPSGSIWINTGTTWTHETIIEDADNAHSGEGYLKAVVSEDTENVWDNQGVVQEITVDDSTSYRLTVWAKATSGDTTTINLTCGEYVTWQEMTSTYGVTLTDEWQKFNLMVFIDTASVLEDNNDTNQIRFPVHFPRKGTYLMDDVSVITSTIAGITAYKNQIRVDFGYQLEWLNDLSASAFTVKVNDSEVTIDSAYMVDLGNDVEPWVDIFIAQEIADGDVVTVSHDGNSGLIYLSTGPITDDEYHAAAFEGEIAELVDTIITPVDEETSAISEINNDKTLNIYPQPAKNTVNIKSTSVIKSLDVYDINGNLVIAGESFNKSFVELNVSGLSNGVYIVKTKLANGKTAIQKFVK